MEIVIEFVVAFADFISALYVFFFSPISELPDLVVSSLGGTGTFSGSVVDLILSALLDLFPFLADVSLAVFLLGSGFIFWLLWRFIKFFVGLFD